MKARRQWRTEVDADLAVFVADRVSFYLGTADAEGWPYIQHRGGPPGFLRVLDRHTLAFADFAGNRQYITVGNIAENDKAFLFLMDYERQVRVKVRGRLRAVEGDAALLAKVATPGYKAKVERVMVFTVEGWDVNCPLHIPKLVAAGRVADAA